MEHCWIKDNCRLSYKDKTLNQWVVLFKVTDMPQTSSKIQISFDRNFPNLTYFTYLNGDFDSFLQTGTMLTFRRYQQ